jgi:hypothetical protein
VFVDANNDGVSQEDEAGVSGVAIHLSNDATSQETTTGDHGAFQFTVPREGFYEVAADPTPECPQLPAFRIVSIVRDDDGTLSGYGHADFACRGGVLPPLPSITGLVFDDRNSNGVADPLELGIAGVAIEISGQRCNAPVLVLHTDEHGRYVVFSEEMPCLPPWQLRRERLDGRCDTTPNPTILRGWPIRQPPMPIVIDFGSAPCDPVPTEPSVEGTVFVDLDREWRP